VNKFWTVAALSLTFASLQQLSANAIVMNFSSILNGAQEVPPTPSPAIGTATGTLTGDVGSYVFNYNVNFSDLTSGLTDAHIHNAPPGVSGPVVHPLDNRSSVLGTTAGSISGDWRFDDPNNPLTDTLAQEMMNGNLYFNLHTATFPAGEIRGQITPAATSVPEPSATVGLLLLGAGSVTYGIKSQKNKQKLAIK